MNPSKTKPVDRHESLVDATCWSNLDMRGRSTIRLAPRYSSGAVGLNKLSLGLTQGAETALEDELVREMQNAEQGYVRRIGIID